MTTQLPFLLIAVAGWMNRPQQAIIEYLQEKNRILLEQFGGKPKRFTDAQRTRLARQAKLVDRCRLGQLATLVTPDTLLRWFRVLVAKTHLIIDHDTQYGDGFGQVLESAGVTIVLGPPRAPQGHASAERFVRSSKEEGLSRLVFLSEEHRHKTLSILIEPSRQRRHDQGIENTLVEPPESFPKAGRIRCQKELGGMLNDSYRQAA